MKRFAFVAFLAIPSAALAEDTTINLLCVGQSAKDEETGTIGSLLSGESDVQRIEMTDSVIMRIEPSNTGEAKVPKRIQSAYKEHRDGWFTLVDLLRTPDEITGKVRMHSMYKPKFRLDRLTGVITISGSIGNFSGRCERYDPTSVQRKF